MSSPPFLYLSKEYPLLTFDQEVMLAKKIIKYTGKRRQEAYDTLVYSNVRLVKKILQKYQYTKLDMDDLFSEGLIGLCIAVDKYDYKKGNRFSTFAYYWIRHKMHRYMEQNTNIIKIPVHIQDTLKAYYLSYEKLLVEKNNEPTIEEISCDCGISVFKLNKALRFGIFTVNSLCRDNDNNEFEIEEKSNKMEDVLFTVSLESLLEDLSDIEVEIFHSLMNNEEFDYEKYNITEKEYKKIQEEMKEKLINELWSGDYDRVRD